MEAGEIFFRSLLKYENESRIKAERGLLAPAESGGVI